MLIRRNHRNNGSALIVMTLLLLGITGVQVAMHWNSLQMHHFILMGASALGLLVVAMMAAGWLLYGRTRRMDDSEAWQTGHDVIEGEIVEPTAGEPQGRN